MTREEAIETLKERVAVDRRIRNNSVTNDYEKFCEKECLAIERLLEEIENKGEK